MAIKDNATATTASVAKAPSARVRRTPVGVRNVLTVSGKEPGYVYRIVNDEGDRVEQFKGAGYDIVSADDVLVGDRRVNKASSEGSAAQVAVGNGVKAVVMRIKQEWYDEDQAAKQRAVAETEAATKSEALKGTYGKLDINRD
jgi:hypothetical protein